MCIMYGWQRRRGGVIFTGQEPEMQERAGEVGVRLACLDVHEGGESCAHEGEFSLEGWGG